MTPQDRLAAAMRATPEADGWLDASDAGRILAADPTIAADMELGRLSRAYFAALDAGHATDAGLVMERIRAALTEGEKVSDVLDSADKPQGETVQSPATHEPTTEAGRALIEWDQNGSPLSEEEWRTRILAIEAEAVKPWREWVKVHAPLLHERSPHAKVRDDRQATMENCSVADCIEARALLAEDEK